MRHGRTGNVSRQEHAHTHTIHSQSQPVGVHGHKAAMELQHGGGANPSCMPVHHPPGRGDVRICRKERWQRPTSGRPTPMRGRRPSGYAGVRSLISLLPSTLGIGSRRPRGLSQNRPVQCTSRFYSADWMVGLGALGIYSTDLNFWTSSLTKELSPTNSLLNLLSQIARLETRAT